MKSFISNRDITLNILLSKVVLEYKKGEVHKDTLDKFCERINKFMESNPEENPLIPINVGIMNILFPLLKQKYLTSDNLQTVLEQFNSIYSTLFGGLKGCLKFSFFSKLLDIEYIIQDIEGIAETEQYLKRLFNNYRELYTQTLEVKNNFFKVCVYNYMLGTILRYGLIPLFDDFIEFTLKVSEELESLEGLNFNNSFEYDITFLQN